MAGGQRTPEPCTHVVETRRYGRLVFIGFTDGQLCRRAERLGARVFYAPHGDRTACYVREEDAATVCSGGGDGGHSDSSTPAGGLSPESRNREHRDGGEKVVITSGAGLNFVVNNKDVWWGALSVATMPRQSTATGGCILPDFEAILERVKKAKRGERHTVAIGAAVSEAVYRVISRRARELEVTRSQLIDALLRYALLTLGWLDEE